VALSAFASPDLWVTADRNRLRQVALNLLDNAIKYTPIGGRVEIYATRDQRGTVILIRDTGIGIAPGEVQRIWDRLYRGQGTRGQPGLGLGLSLVRAIVHAHHGRVEVSSRPHEGSDFTVVFPLTSRHQDERAAAADLSKL
jgi:signal transduction histidine kinase